jgi:uncharacterized protein (TIGR03067 family)
MSMPMILAFLLSPVHAEPGAEAKAELKKLQGTWQLIATEANGKTLNEKARVEFERGTPLLKKIVIKDSTMQYFLEKDQESEALPFELDTSARPRVVRWSLLKDNPPEFWSIYAIEGDTLKVALSLRNASDKAMLPKEFKTKELDGNYVFLFKRAKS